MNHSEHQEHADLSFSMRQGPTFTLQRRLKG
jgi:hypothetical protein